MKIVKRLNEGFTLVELMVVVAIIGILSAVAIPNFKKYQAKSKTSEAKLQLASIYSAETAFMADADTYATCLDSMGYNPTLEKASRYYITGFTNDSTANNNATTNGIACVAGFSNFEAGKKVGGQIANNPGFLTLSNVPPTGQTFTATAAGYIDSAYAAALSTDRWTVNENKLFVHTQSGY